jgi:hypothetical protein
MQDIVQMSLEKSFERIAAALELIAANLAPRIITSDAAPIVDEKPAAPVQPAGTQPVDDFLNEKPATPPKPPTLEELRAALQEYAAKHGTGAGPNMAKARELLGKYGNGATRLAVAKDVPGGDQGVIEPKYYQAVIDACKEAAV